MEDNKIFKEVFEYIDRYYSDWSLGEKFIAALKITNMVMEPIKIDFKLEDKEEWKLVGYPLKGNYTNAIIWITDGMESD